MHIHYLNWENVIHAIFYIFLMYNLCKKFKGKKFGFGFFAFFFIKKKNYMFQQLITFSQETLTTHREIRFPWRCVYLKKKKVKLEHTVYSTSIAQVISINSCCLTVHSIFVICFICKNSRLSLKGCIGDWGRGVIECTVRCVMFLREKRGRWMDPHTNDDIWGLSSEILKCTRQ